MIENLYLPNGYLDMGAVISAPYPFIIVIGARGTGKTYGALKYCAENGVRFCYMRRTDRILKIITDPAYQPFKKINTDSGLNVAVSRGHGFGVFQDDRGILGYAAALSTFANVRGFDGSDIEVLIFDEFVPEPGERVAFNMFRALLNAIETIGRNRELEGRPPLKTVLLSNSDLIYGDIINGFRIGSDLLEMQETGTEQKEKSADMLLIRPAAEMFAEKKSRTALFRVTEGTDFYNVALKNEFPVENRERLRLQPLTEFSAAAAISGICFYRHKHRNEWYVCRTVSGDPVRYENSKKDMLRFFRENPSIEKAYLKNRLWFSDVDVQTTVRRLFS